LKALGTLEFRVADLAGPAPDLRPRDHALPFVAVYAVNCDQALPCAASRVSAAAALDGQGYTRDAGARRKALLRQCTRWLLGAHLGLRADAVPIERNRHDAPRLGPSWTGARLAFSSTLCGAEGAIAIGSGEVLGIDLERADAQRFAAALAAHLLHAREWARFERVRADDRAAWLTRAWVGKEATLKALGLGLNRDPREIDVMGALADPEATMPSTFSPAPYPRLAGRWHLDGSLVGALVMSQPPVDPTWRRLVLT